ncbi:DUF2309 domain-containing protein [Marinobacter fuscus]|uniref:Probable inorganic carbon transporter subunit DabA n=1 Tax=Marinobacter fuscus TaxID=2109942 RepID=A0A2T1KRA6_9GAMM|nr:DUF2309 domain-containing protein [Marinobacter fuscus]PSF12162.1 DUF2309 domain-containing protein [Marinobacter fuscus]
MNAPVNAPVVKSSAIAAQVIQACEGIAPMWPLDRWIAVNPWWGQRHQAVETASFEREMLCSGGMLMPPAFYLSAWRSGRIKDSDLQQAASFAGEPTTVEQLVEQLRAGSTSPHGFPSALAGFASNSEALRLAREQIGQACMRYFDQRQSRWQVPVGQRTLWQFWLEESGKSGAAPDGWEAAVTHFGAQLPYTDAQRPWAIQHLLGQLPGWAAWCRGMDWRAGLEQPDNSGAAGLCAQLATIWLSCEHDAAIGLTEAERQHWHERLKELKAYMTPDWHTQNLWVWHNAYELAWQKRFLTQLDLACNRRQSEPEKPQPTEVQAAFCIDVRSEVLRRHLESEYPAVQTLGVAGFFGMPIAHARHGTGTSEPRLPGLLAPAYRLSDTLGDAAADAKLSRSLEQREQVRESVRRAKYSSLSTFTLVETTGLAWAWKLVRDGLNRNTTTTDAGYNSYLETMGGQPLPLQERVDLAEGILSAMSLTANFAPIVLLVGHGAHTDNNPNEAGLACGACGGNNGGVNARAAAALLNTPDVRQGLAGRGIVLPETTRVLAAEHCTVTDQVRVFDADALPEGSARILDTLKQKLAAAGTHCRRERATVLGLKGETDVGLLAELKRRTRNWAEVRPEWGLANNAAMVIGSRSLTRNANLAGRCFLQEYDPDLDKQGDVLAALMAAPMVVANWINLQYFGSVARPTVFGAGNKLLHSVVGGNLGVIEGNDVDLRQGLPLQSVFDGKHWRHEPMRLAVVIQAPAERIEAVLASHTDVGALIENRWLWLYRTDGQTIQRYRGGRWETT